MLAFSVSGVGASEFRGRLAGELSDMREVAVGGSNDYYSCRPNI